MKTKELLNRQVSIFKCSTDSDRPYYTSTLFDFLTEAAQKSKYKIEYLRKLNLTDKKQAKEYKLNELLCATVSGTFYPKRRSLNIENKTGIISVDIDAQDNIGMDVEHAKIDVMNLPFVFLAMKSSRGEGICCFVHYNTKHYIGFVVNALKKEFKKLGYNIDTKCRDICRLRIVSWDDNILLKKEVECYEGFEEDEKIERREGEFKDWNLTKDDIREISKIIYVLVEYNDYRVDDYYEWLYEGWRLSTIPNEEIGFSLFLMISENSLNYEGEDDVRQKFEECKRTTHNSSNVLGYYINKAKEIYGNDWRRRINDILRQQKIDF